MGHDHISLIRLGPNAREISPLGCEITATIWQVPN
jgi:hypothetical protein